VGTSEKYKLFLYPTTVVKPETGFFLYFSGLPYSTPGNDGYASTHTKTQKVKKPEKRRFEAVPGSQRKNLPT